MWLVQEQSNGEEVDLVMEQKWKGDGKVIDESWKGERKVMKENRKGKGKVNEDKLMLREAGFVVLVIIIFLQYFKLAGYLENKYFFASDFMGILLLILGIPLSYFAAKFLVRIIKSIL